MKVVIIGAGEVGFHIAGHLAAAKKSVAVIDCDRDALRRVSDSIDAQAIVGSGKQPADFGSGRQMAPHLVHASGNA